MSLVSIDDFKAHVDTALSDSALQDLLDEAEQAVVRTVGPLLGEITERITSVHGSLLSLLERPVEITSVTERGDRLLAADDYEMIGTLLHRLSTGTNPGSHWRAPLTVVYIPESDVPDRQRVIRALVALELNHSPGVRSEQIGAWRQDSGAVTDYEVERAAILGTLGANDAGIF
jgi:hypothetical protein